jgi:cytochrome c551/c552
MRQAMWLAMCVSGAVAGTALGQTESEMGARFRQGCMSCHQPPDKNFATDRAWLDQVNRTA